MREIWKPAPGHEDLYEVSNLGRVRTVDSRKLKYRQVNAQGYLRIRRQRGKRLRQHILVHRLVAKAFCTGEADGLVVDHINRIKTDNRSENLRWVTPYVNLINSARFETKPADAKFSRYLGVIESGPDSVAAGKPYRPRVKLNRKPYFSGCFKSEVVAAMYET